MTRILDGGHLAVDEPVCARCFRCRQPIDCTSDNGAIVALGVFCPTCDAVTVVRYVLDPFVAGSGAWRS